MPHAATHVIISLIIGSLIRDYFINDKKKFPLHYVLIFGLAGLLPDLDIAVYWIAYWFGSEISEIHRMFTHTLLFSLLFFFLSAATIKLKNKELGKHHLRAHTIFWIIGVGILVHLALDASLAGRIMPFYPIDNYAIGINLIDYMPLPLADIFFPCLDAALLVLWLIYIEWKHKISDFI